MKSSEFVPIAATKGEGQSASNDESESSGVDSAETGVVKGRGRLNSNWSEVLAPNVDALWVSLSTMNMN